MIEKKWFPSKTIDLTKECIVETINIENLINENINIPLFSIFLSSNDADWVCYYTQSDHYWENPVNFDIHLDKKILTRYIKFQLNSYGNINSLNIITKPNEDETYFETVSSVIDLSQQQEKQSKVIISTLFNESDDYLMLYLNNFLFFTPENTFLILNFPKDRTIPIEASFLNERIIIFNGNVERQKWGNTLLLGHLESLQYANDNLQFDFFCTMASNALFVKPLKLSAIFNQLNQKSLVPIASQRSYNNDTNVDVNTATNKGSWMWHHYNLLPQLKENLSEKMSLSHVSATQIEGLFAHKNDWFLVLEQVKNIEDLSPFLPMEFFVALEELIPISIFNMHGSGLYTHICYMLWRKETFFIDTHEIISIGSYLPDHISSIKWFNRSTSSPATLSVCTQWGRQLIGLEKSIYFSSALQSTVILKDMLETTKQQIKTLPFTTKWYEDSEQKNSQINLYWYCHSYHVNRQRFKLNIHNQNSEMQSPVHIFLEDTGHFLDLSFLMTQDNSDSNCNILHYSCLVKDEKDQFCDFNTSDLEGYLYISSQLEGKSIKISMDTNKIKNYDLYQSLFERFVVHDESQDNYYVINSDLVEESNGYKNFYFNNCKYIGIPILSNQLLDIKLSIF